MESISLILLIILLSDALSAIIIYEKSCNIECKKNPTKSNIIRYEESTDKKSEISRTKYDEYLHAVKYVEQLNKVKGFASEILSGEWCDQSPWNDYSLDISPWDKFAYSMLNKPEFVKFNFDKCPICGKNRIRIYHQGEENDIVGKYILICRNCKKYFDYKTFSGLKSNDTKSLQEADCISERFAYNVEVVTSHPNIRQNYLSENCLIGNAVMTGRVVRCMLSVYLFRDYASFFVMRYCIWSHGWFFVNLQYERA